MAEESNVVDRILEAVLPLIDYDPYSYELHRCSPIIHNNPFIQQRLIQYNPETHVLVTKEQLDITNQLKDLAKVAEQVNDVYRELTKLYPNICTVKSGVDFIVSRYTKHDEAAPVTESKEDIKLRLKTQWATPKQ